MKTKTLLITSVFALLFSQSCKDKDEPEIPAEQEIITDVRLIFNPSTGDPLIFHAEDPDGEGPADIEVSEEIELASGTIYTLFIELENSVAGEDITEEVEEESDAHQFYFEFTTGLFENPTGNGNVDMPETEAVDYQDEDVNGLPVGLITRWGTGVAKSGKFRVILKHQPEIKSATSTALDGESDVDLEWDLSIN